MNDVRTLALGVVAAGLPEGGVDALLPRFGGYIFFARNGTSVERVREHTDALRAHYRGEPAPLLAIDQEGGRVARLREGLEPMPAMMALGAVNDLELAGRVGEQIAFDLRRAGCTFDFAPVLDLALDARNTVIGTRSFGSDPQAVAALGAAVGGGLERGGILTCYKHFPGHGSTSVDSHESLPAIDVDLRALRERDLVPFAAVAPTARAIMGAHIVVRSVDDRLPATLSPASIGDLLRHTLGFSGAFVTDCLEMGAVAEHTPAPDAAVAALAAGADLLLFSHDLDGALAAVETIERAVRDGRLSQQRLQEAYARVMRLREAAALPLAIDEFAPHPGVGREAARRAVTLVRGLAHDDPLTSCAIYFAESVEVRLRREAPALEELTLPLDPEGATVDGVLKRLDASQRRPLLLAHRAHLHPAQAEAIERVIAACPDAIVVSTVEPYDLPLFQTARHLLATYGNDAASIEGLADVLFGGSLPEGRLPVEVAAGV
jgi:beta-N-acetylhexosaminidase